MKTITTIEEAQALPEKHPIYREMHTDDKGIMHRKLFVREIGRPDNYSDKDAVMFFRDTDGYLKAITYYEDGPGKHRVY